MNNAIRQIARLIMRNASPAAGLLGFAGGATYASNNVKEVMPDFLIEKKAEEIAKNQEYAKSLVQLAMPSRILWKGVEETRRYGSKMWIG